MTTLLIRRSLESSETGSGHRKGIFVSSTNCENHISTPPATLAVFPLIYLQTGLEINAGPVIPVSMLCRMLPCARNVELFCTSCKLGNNWLNFVWGLVASQDAKCLKKPKKLYLVVGHSSDRGLCSRKVLLCPVKLTAGRD